MIIEYLDRRTVRSALQLAVRAPSVHNSQPWRLVLGRSSVHLYADLGRWLPATDPDARGLMQSCGTLLHHLQVALAASGISATVHRLPDPDRPEYLAAIGLRPTPPTDTRLGLAAAIVRRRTDRRRFGSWDVPDSLLHELAGTAAEQGVVLRHVSDTWERSILLDAIRDAAAGHEADAAYRTETALWSGRFADDSGVPAANLLKDLTDAGTARRFSLGLLEQADPQAGDGAALMVLGTTTDDPRAQLRAGEAISAVLLHATELGLATCPLSQPLEVGWTRAKIRDELLGGTLLPQLVLRVGWAPPGRALPPTPRRPIDETIDHIRRPAAVSEVRA
jgi:nitroreductase